MHTTRVSALGGVLCLLCSLTQAVEPSALPALPGLRQVMETLPRREAGAPRRPSAASEYIRIDLNFSSDGAFSVTKPFIPRIDLRGERLYAQELDYRISGWIGDDFLTGNALSKLRDDPRYGYTLTSPSLNATLDKSGEDWTVQGHYQRKEPSGATTRVPFRFLLRRDASDRYEVDEIGLDLTIRIGKFGATVAGWVDKEKIAMEPLAVIGAFTGILCQPRLNPNPRPAPLP